MAGAEAQHSFCGSYGPADAVPLLQSFHSLSFSAACESPGGLSGHWIGPAEAVPLLQSFHSLSFSAACESPGCLSGHWIGPAEAVPLLQSFHSLSFSAACEAPEYCMGAVSARLRPCPDYEALNRNASAKAPG
jgi:hypothetical protein